MFFRLTCSPEGEQVTRDNPPYFHPGLSSLIVLLCALTKPARRSNNRMKRCTHGRVMPDIVGLRPLEPLIYAGSFEFDRRLNAKAPGNLSQCMPPEIILRLMVGKAETQLIDGIAGSHQHLGLSVRHSVILKSAKRNPACEDMA